MPKPHWYVIQVETGREQQSCELIARACHMRDAENPGKPPLASEVFSPRYQTQFKHGGEWHDEKRLLLPGYVVAVTRNPWELARVLRAIPGLTRILTMGETYAPLSTDDRQWIERWTTEGDRTIPMSVAYKEGDKVVVASGPLKGLEFLITRVRRRQCVAELELHAGLITIKTKVGLAVFPKQGEEEVLLFAGAGDGEAGSQA